MGILMDIEELSTEIYRLLADAGITVITVAVSEDEFVITVDVSFNHGNSPYKSTFEFDGHMTAADMSAVMVSHLRYPEDISGKGKTFWDWEAEPDA